MSVKSKIDIFKKMTKTELEREISKYAIHYRYYQRLMVIKMIADGYSIADAANEINRSYPTVHNWVMICEKEGLIGLRPSFGGGGHNAKLSKSQLIELDKYISENPNMTLKKLCSVIKEKYNADYTTKQVRVIAGKLGYDYRRKSPNFYKAPISG